MGSLLNEFKDLTVTYAKQETVDPLKSLGRYLSWGVIGAVVISVGAVLIALGVVRAIQFETAPHLTGNWSWVPYIGGLLLAGLVAGLAAMRITKTPANQTASSKPAAR